MFFLLFSFFVIIFNSLVFLFFIHLSFFFPSFLFFLKDEHSLSCFIIIIIHLFSFISFFLKDSLTSLAFRFPFYKFAVVLLVQVNPRYRINLYKKRPFLIVASALLGRKSTDSSSSFRAISSLPRPPFVIFMGFGARLFNLPFLFKFFCVLF